MIRGLAVFFCLICAGPSVAIELSMPAGSRIVSDRGSPFGSYAVPVGPWSNGAVETITVEGRVDRQSWRVESGSITTLQVLDPLRDQLAEKGFETVFECNFDICGGFDFRFAIEVIPTPDMFVDIRDYRFLAAKNDESSVSLLVSRSRTSAYIQFIQVAPPEQGALRIVAEDDPTPVTQQAEAQDFSSGLIGQGHQILGDLNFETGSTNLSDGDYQSLLDLAEFMLNNPTAVIALVGHTDATGDLDINIRVSQQRAEAVRARLIEEFGVPENRLQAEGMGYLAPRDTNLTPEGRERNRRVEAVLLSLE